MAAKLSTDSLDREKRGRLLKDHQYEAAARARVATLLNTRGPIGHAQRLTSTGGGRSTTGGGRSSTGRATGFAAKAPSRESVLKVIGWSKAARSARNQARYVARVRENDREKDLAPLDMENERGDVLTSRAAVDAEVASWDLLTDRDNLSAAARKLDPAERNALPDRDKLDRRQTVHLVFSIPARSTTDPEKLRAAMRVGLADTFGDAGHRYLFTIHTEHSARPHAHVIVKVMREQDGTAGRAGKALRLNPADLEALRHTLTKHAQDRGIEVIATRREDRAELRAEILAGKEPLRADRSWHQQKQTTQGRTFERSAPNWYRQFGPEYERRRAEAATGRGPSTSPAAGTPAAPTSQEAKKPAAGILRRILGRAGKTDAPDSAIADPGKAAKGYFGNFANVRAGQAAKAAAGRDENPAIAQLGAHFERSHQDPAAARQSFLALYREAPKLALWAAHNHPETFGATTGAKPDRIPTSLLKQLPEEARPTQEAWTAQQERAQKDEIQDLRRATSRARSARSAEQSAEAIRRSIEKAADAGGRAIKHDVTTARETDAELRALAKTIAPSKAPTSTPAGDKAAQYAELEARVRRFDQAAGRRRQKEKTRDRDGGRER